jgi:hypothetical protein
MLVMRATFGVGRAFRPSTGHNGISRSKFHDEGKANRCVMKRHHRGLRLNFIRVFQVSRETLETTD